MANFFEKKDRHLIPNWRSFENTAKLGELNGSTGIKLDSSFKPDISDLLENWQDSQTIAMAGDILGTALVCNQEENPTVREVSKFILENRDIAPNAIINAATNVLKPKSTEITLNIDISKPELFENKSNLVEIHLMISSLRKKLIQTPYNPIHWVELGRYYSILGQDHKAERALKNAIYLAPENRFILRSVARFFVHVGDFETAHDLVRKNRLTKHDPWLIATEISLATLRERNSIFTKTGLNLVNSNNFHPFNISELAGSIATLDLKNASIKDSKKMFQKSLIQPNDNALAQAEWASQEEKNLLRFNLDDFHVINSFEAKAREFFEQGEWQNSIDFSRKWFFDQPFSKKGILFGNEVAARNLHDNKQAVEIAKLGLLSHPNDPHLLNNIIYALCLDNELDEAEKYLNLVKKEDLNSKNYSGICLTATRGLLLFRQGNPEAGRALYQDVMTVTKEQDNQYYNSLALINYVREEVIIGNKEISSLIPSLEKIIANNKDSYLASEGSEVLNLFKKRFKL